MRYTRRYLWVLQLIALFCWVSIAEAQTVDAGAISGHVQAFKKDVRGPYQAIRWYCPDGRVLPADQRCNQPGSIQHAMAKDVVQRIARDHHIFLGQILAGTPYDDFWDAAYLGARAKQYQIEKYLQAVDDGWILRKARFYRGAIQAEDEAEWGRQFLMRLVSDRHLLTNQYFFVRELFKDIPHEGTEDRWQVIRAVSKTLSDSIPAFMDLRIKLHGQPDQGDIERVRSFRRQNPSRKSKNIEMMFDQLENNLVESFRPFDVQSLRGLIAGLPATSQSAQQLTDIIKRYGQPASGASRNISEQMHDFSNLLLQLRKDLPGISSTQQRFKLMNTSLALEKVLFRLAGEWRPTQLAGQLNKAYALARAAAGCGYVEMWEWEAAAPLMEIASTGPTATLGRLIQQVEYTRRVVEWGVGMIRAVYVHEVERFAEFEPIANGFIDDRVRSSVLLPLGDLAGDLREHTSREIGISNRVMDLTHTGQIQGLNPGYALGELRVITGSPDAVEFAADKIYIVQRPPADLKPVAGIATVSEGNLVSHVQLLARNLGIPNAVVSQQNLTGLLPYHGRRVFYAVSPRGAVILKPAEAMTATEKALFDTRKRPEERIAVPIDRLDLERLQMVNLKALRASDSGKLCGPKAANLGELKYLFPEKVVEGFAIPFGLFRAHFNQLMPGEAISYWQYLQATFERANSMRRSGGSEAEIETHVLERLASLRNAIQKMPFLPDFREKIRNAFLANFSTSIGSIPVFIRSDTNMEDLKDFTGAGLNLTVFNVRDEVKIYQAVRDVWASPYTERSYRWRQKYLLNPENVFPSILILPTVNVDMSGVMITTGISSNDPRDITVAFSRGAGGAVEGQAAESYLLQDAGASLLLSPARETTYTQLPAEGGIKKGVATFEKPLLNAGALQQLRSSAAEIRRQLNKNTRAKAAGPHDVELGFKDDKLWLFQVRPFVENKRARSSAYLRTLDPEIALDKKISYGN